MVFSKKITIIKVLLFGLLIGGLIICLGILFQPTFGRENNYLGIKEFRNEPDDSIDTLFLGSSVIYHGISATELYRDYGICSWNLGSSSQPVSASYYLLQDVYRRQSGSLKTVIFDVYQVKTNSTDSFRRSAVDAIKDYDIKYKANRDYAVDFTEAIDYTIPVISYHNRWSELSNDDFIKLKGVDRSYLRGYYLDTIHEYYDLCEDYTEITLPNCNWDEINVRTAFPEETMYYLRRMIDFCREHDLELILFKTPMGVHWNAADHNAIQDIADSYGVTFLDANYEPIIDEVGHNYAADQADGEHLNYYGVKKLTSWVGRYLIENGKSEDVRGQEKYRYLDDVLVKYKDKVTDLVYLKDAKDVADYLETATGKSFYTVIISVKDDATASLTDEQRRRFEEIGLTSLSSLGFRDSYC